MTKAGKETKHEDEIINWNIAKCQEKKITNKIFFFVIASN